MRDACSASLGPRGIPRFAVFCLLGLVINPIYRNDELNVAQIRRRRKGVKKTKRTVQRFERYKTECGSKKEKNVSHGHHLRLAPTLSRDIRYRNLYFPEFSVCLSLSALHARIIIVPYPSGLFSPYSYRTLWVNKGPARSLFLHLSRVPRDIGRTIYPAVTKRPLSPPLTRFFSYRQRAIARMWK